MTVRELIEELKKANPDLPVRMVDEEDVVRIVILDDKVYITDRPNA